MYSRSHKKVSIFKQNAYYILSVKSELRIKEKRLVIFVVDNFIILYKASFD